MHIISNNMSSNVFYYSANLNNDSIMGVAIYDTLGNIIGITSKFTRGEYVAVSVIEIRELYEQVLG